MKMQSTGERVIGPRLGTGGDGKGIPGKLGRALGRGQHVAPQRGSGIGAGQKQEVERGLRGSGGVPGGWGQGPGDVSAPGLSARDRDRVFVHSSVRGLCHVHHGSVQGWGTWGHSPWLSAGLWGHMAQCR